MRIFKRKRSKSYYVRFWIGGREYKCSLRTTDRRVADRRASEIYARETRRHLGLIDEQAEHAKRPLADHLGAFESMLKAKHVTEAHRLERMQHLRDFANFGGATRLSDLRDGAATRWIPELRESLSARSVNKRIAALRQFGRWLRKTRRMPYDPFEILDRQNEEADRRHVRRALTPDEFHRLLKAARIRPLAQAQKNRTRTGVTEKAERKLRALGEARALVYLLAAGAGLRRSEMYRLRWRDVDFEHQLVRLTATKSGREQAVPLHPDLKEVLMRDRGDAAPADPVIPARCFPNAQTFTNDLAAADIPKADDRGRTVDLHALRGTMVTWLKDAGVHPAVAQRAARHAKIDTTIRHYTHVIDQEVRSALAKVPLQRPLGNGNE
jgi:integrase